MKDALNSLGIALCFGLAVLLGFAIAAKTEKPCPAVDPQKIVLEVHRVAD